MNYTIPFFGTTVNQDVVLIMVLSYVPMILSGMVRAVLDMRLPVVLLLRCRGLSRHYIRQFMMIMS